MCRWCGRRPHDGHQFITQAFGGLDKATGRNVDVTEGQHGLATRHRWETATIDEVLIARH